MIMIQRYCIEKYKENPKVMRFAGLTMNDGHNRLHTAVGKINKGIGT